ncbi:MAG TPA: EAL domain-containing protein [Solirubrobacteraceae bacterium]|nr:EAL domain-containing protein [Solirubrobacteraceae bacterium]
MLRCLVACGTEPTPGAHAQEAARLLALFVGDLCVVALASEDRRTFGPFAVESRSEPMTAMMQQAIAGADHERAAWPLAGRALISGEPVVIDRIRPGELEGIVNPAMDGYLGSFGLSAVVFVAMRGAAGATGIIGMGRGPGRPGYTPDEIAATQRIADAIAGDAGGEPGTLLPLLIGGGPGAGTPTERRFAKLVERLPAIVYEAEPGAEGLWLYVSAFVETLLGHTPQEWMADPTLWARSVHEDDREAVLAAEDRLTAGERIAIEYRMHARDGSVVWVRDESARAVDEQGRLLVEGILTDITERKASEDRLQHLADHDGLTDLLNRRRFVEELELEIAATGRGMRSSAVVVLDIDGFKYVNDSLGHQAGDELIRAVARTLQGRLRGSDAIARLGGDEFACLLRGAGGAEADAVAAELVATLREQQFRVGEEAVRVTASAGIAGLEPDGAATADTVLAAADMAMYEAKRAGRDRVVRLTTALRAELERGRSWVARLQEALEHDGFELLAQPVLALSSGEVAMHELLLRLRDEDGELCGPEAFMTVAERFDLAEAIDRWVLRRALALQRERGAAAERLSVNLSARSIGPDVVALLEQELLRGGAERAKLVVEIKESAAMADLQQARTFADALARLGVEVALDDFGAGLGSFSSLRALSIDYLKIDGEFVGGVAGNPVDREIVKAIVALARAAGRRTIAELVPDQETLELLRELGVDLAQGFHVGRPRPLEEL